MRVHSVVHKTCAWSAIKFTFIYSHIKNRTVKHTCCTEGHKCLGMLAQYLLGTLMYRQFGEEVLNEIVRCH